MSKCKGVTYARHGVPGEVVKVAEIEVPAPAPDEVLVKMLAAPINPVDLNMIEGKYPVRPPLPAVAGVEGVGEVAALGEAVRDLHVGRLVLVPHGFGSWRELGVAAADQLVPLPDDVAIDEAAMLKINPPTAWRMLHDFVALREGDWVLQNAANSGVGRAVIQIAHALGWRTVNVVRRAGLLDELRAEGGDVVLLDGSDLPQQIETATGGATARLALNAVGGESAIHLANALAPGGTIVTYGAMARQPLRIPNGLLIFKDLRWRGFWVTQWYRDASRHDVLAMFKQLLPLLERRQLRGQVERSYPLAEAAEAVRHAGESKRAGKVLFRCG